MNKIEINEIRRRFKPEYSNFNHIYGYYVNSSKNLISSFDTSLLLMEQEEKEMYLKLLKKTLSGTLGRNLVDIEFATQQVINEPEHKLLMDLKTSSLKDEEKRNELFNKIVASVDFEDTDFLILMAADNYDVPYKDKNDEIVMDASGEMFSYFVCCVCPVKEAKLELKYDSDNGRFHSISSGHAAQGPEMGFMFPAFDDRATNIYNALYYVRSSSNIHQDFIDSVFHTNPVMSPAEQKASFQNLIEDGLENDCSFEIVQNVNDEIIKRIEAHKEAKIPRALELSVREVEDILKDSGVEEEKVSSFRDVYIERFGTEPIVPGNIVSVKKFDVETPEIKITVSPENSYLIRTKIIDGKKYILIPASDGVKVNGISVTINDEE